MTDDIHGLPVLVAAGVGYVLVVDGADVVGCLRHVAVNIRDDGTTWRPPPVVLEDGTTWSPLPPTRDPTQDRAAARYAASLAATRVLKSPLAEAFGVEEHLTPVPTLALAPAWAERVLNALAEGRTSVEIIDEWRDLNGPLLRASVLYAALLVFQEQHWMSAALRAERAVVTRSLDSEDRLRLDELFLYQGGCMMRDRWFEYHLDRWDRFATSLDGLTASWDRSYISDIAEYGNDLSHRDILDEALSLLSRPGRVLVEPFVASVDERYRACTRPVETPVEPGAGTGNGKGCWWFRIPPSVGDSFERQAIDRTARRRGS